MQGYFATYFKLPRLNINVELREKIAQHARKMASENEFVAGVILFGSIARGEETEQSDVDLLILWEKLNVDPRKRHVYIYKTVSKYFPPNLRLTVLDMEYNSLLKTTKLTPLLLNIIQDAVVLYDRHNKLQKFISNTRKQLKAKNTRRIKTGKTYYWKLPKPGAKVKLEV
ncbi:MAG: hypothetical protein DRJ55_05130 [Thermoprotei archaeon]|nr:MAG: hypothetical protein DRJ55_05130 [Thermoprotei archaeon]